ncbi:T9SS sorting signal type C domain-containing protein [Flavobacterium sp. LS1R49]|uniref:T9SS sorting signal type C domain-containing protein n=1 Tax=Flavobacterium shii TaxID=2987687 RepID=A0A9X2YUZ9_9FLAO|nr:T9SS sorting signal type C domain-containing protein [Flavobacterium shii]MCV9927694.1 T9SS sorting signal type C domain-containing protein [Flavobacterium shii]
MKRILFLLLFLPALGFTQIVDFVQWTGSTDLTPTIINNYIIATNVTGSGLATGPTASYDGIIGTGWPKANVIDTSKYFQIVVGQILDGKATINQIQFTYKGNSSSYQVMYSKQADFSNPINLGIVTNASINNTPVNGNLTGLNIPVDGGENIYIRFYAYNGGGDWKLMNANLLKVSGTINKVPSPMSGSYVIGNNTSANFPTITSAVNALNEVGISGNVIFLLDNTNYNRGTNEIFPININSYTGNTSYKVTFKPNIGKTVTIESTNFPTSSSTPTVFKLNGTDNIIFDGSNNNTSSKDLTIYNNNPLNQKKAVIWITSENNANGANNNEIKNLILKQYYKDDDLSVGVFSGGNSSVSSAAEAANSYNTIKNVTFTKVGQAIYLNGNNTSLSSDWKIQNNIIGGTTDADKPFAGIALNNAKDYDVSGNTIDGLLKNSTNAAGTLHSGIIINGKSNGLIYKNIIRDVYNATGDYTYCAGIYINSTNNIVYNNMISNIRTSAINDDTYNYNTKGHGIYIENNNNKIYHNTIYMNATNTGGRSSCIYIKSGNTLSVVDNILYNIQTQGTQYLILNEGNSAFTTIDYNDYYYTSANAKIGRFGFTDSTSLANWQTATGNQDSHSLNLQPTFLSGLYLNANNTTNKLLVGTSLAAVTTDIDGVTRTKPYMGAHELVSCSQGDQNTFGNNSWIGYVYNWTGSPAATDYIGYVTEPTLFDRNIGDGQVNGTTRFICGTPPSDKFFVRYKMKTTTVAGTYNITIGSDDGARLYIDGVLVSGLNQWNDHAYTSYAVQQTLTAGVHEFILEYYENAGSSRISFSYGQINTNMTLNQPYGDKVWNVYGYTTPNFALPASSFAGTYLDTNLNIDTTNFWNKAASPSAATSWQGAPVPIDNFTTSHKRKGFPCGRYNIQVANCDDDAEIYLNGTKIYTAGGNINAPTLINTSAYYQLDKNSEVEVRLKENAGDALLVINFIDVPYVYNGSTPPSGGSIIVNDNLALDSNIEVCSCTIAAGKKFTVNSDKLLVVNENITVGTGGKLIIKNNGSLVQTNDNATYTGAADSFEMERITKPVYLFDFTYWSSPLTIDSGFTLKKLSPNTLWDKYYYYNPTTGYVTNDNGTEVMIPGKGYLVRAPQDFSRDPSVKTLYTANFIGRPNNGINSLNVTTVGTYPTANLIGNPYPSALSADLFYAQNSTLIKGTFYFWTHNTRISSTPDANGIYNYSAADYISYNATGSTGTGDITNCTTCGSTKATGSIASGQGFFVEAKVSGSLTYNNAMRVKTLANNSEFSKPSKSQKQATATIEKNRVWLNLKNDEGQYNEMLLGYITGATNDKDDAYDGSSYASGTAIYSVLDNENLVIQGRALPFDETEIIPLGIITSTAGDYTIGIESLDGFFQNQRVFLTDKTTNTTTNLKNTRYSFKSEPGTFNDRFTLSFSQKTLGIDTPELAQNGIVIFNKNHQVQISSDEQNIESVVIYDILGKTIYKKDTINNITFSTGEIKFPNQVVIVKVKTENNLIITKKIIL